MRIFGRIETSYWQNPKTRALSERARLLHLYLLTSPHGNAVGCYVLPSGYAQCDLAWDAETLDGAFRELIAAGMVDHDPHSGLMRIVGWFDHNRIENRNVAIAAVKTMTILPKASPVYRRLLQSIQASRNELRGEAWAVFEPAVNEALASYSDGQPEAVPDGLGNPIETVSDGYGNGIEVVPEKGVSERYEKGIETVSNLVGNGIDTKEPNLTDNKNGAASPDAPPPAAAFLDTPKDKLFNFGVPYLQRRAGKSDDQARRVIGGWLKGSDPETVLAAMAKAQAEQAIEPISYVAKILKPRKPDNDGRPAAYQPGGL